MLVQIFHPLNLFSNPQNYRPETENSTPPPKPTHIHHQDRSAFLNCHHCATHPRYLKNSENNSTTQIGSFRLRRVAFSGNHASPKTMTLEIQHHLPNSRANNPYAMNRDVANIVASTQFGFYAKADRQHQIWLDRRCATRTTMHPMYSQYMQCCSNPSK